MNGESLIQICIRNNGNHRTYKYKDILKKMGFQFGYKGKKYWYMERPKEKISEKDILEIKGFCRKKHLRIEIADTDYSRNSNYRKDFFNNTKPFFKDKYFCIYCGRLLPMERLEVDHIIPVKQAETDIKVQKYIQKHKWSGINDIHNLGASCTQCNSKKGKRMGLWPVRGMIGKSNIFQLVRHVIKIMMAIIFICLAIAFCSAEGL